jgi:SAM-dependent methyltransferase
VNTNIGVWETGDYVAEYDNRVLRPVEIVLLARYRESLSGRVLEIGSGAGRVLGYLVALGGDVHGIDVSARMVERCRARYPAADVRIGDMTALATTLNGPFAAILATYNVLDVLLDAPRRQVLADVRRLLTPGGLFIFSSHNLAHIAGQRARLPPGKALRRAMNRPPSHVFSRAIRLPRRAQNRHRLARLQQRFADHAIINDEALDHGLLHYYIGRDDQDKQLVEAGYELVECLDLEGQPVASGETGRSPELHYVARRR